MNSLLDTIPKTLPIDNPLLFSFLMIIDSVEFQVRFDGEYSRQFDKDTPAFNYAVNSWSVTKDDQNNRTISQDVLCALWKDKPDADECKIEWVKVPSGDSTSKDHKMSYAYTHEEWRMKTFEELDQIISLLTYKDDSSERHPTSKEKIYYLSQIFQWAIVDESITYVYAKDTTANKFYGVGATFTLNSPFKNDCCPKIEDNKLQLDYFKSIGFVFPDLLN